MPIIKSKAQNRWARAVCAKGGKSRKAACEAVREVHGRKLGGLPERVGKKPRKGGRTRKTRRS